MVELSNEAKKSIEYRAHIADSSANSLELMIKSGRLPETRSFQDVREELSYYQGARDALQEVLKSEDRRNPFWHVINISSRIAPVFRFANPFRGQQAEGEQTK